VVAPENIEIDNLTIGSLNLSKWLELSGGRSPTSEIAPVLLPTQDMRPFQRRLRTQTKVQAVAATQAAAFSVDVPNNENWRLVLMWISHVNLGTGGVVFQFRRTFTHLLPGLPFTLWEGEIDDTSVGEVIYPSAVQRARVAVNRFVDLRGDEGVEFFRGDNISVVQSDAAVTPGTVTIAIAYEIIPDLANIDFGPAWLSTSA